MTNGKIEWNTILLKKRNGMVEKVARALIRNEWDNTDKECCGLTREEYELYHWKSKISPARAAIEAMRDNIPSEAIGLAVGEFYLKDHEDKTIEELMKLAINTALEG